MLPGWFTVMELPGLLRFEMIDVESARFAASGSIAKAETGHIAKANAIDNRKFRIKKQMKTGGTVQSVVLPVNRVEIRKL